MNPNAPPQANTAPIAPSPVPRVLNAGGNASEKAKDASGPKKVHEVFVGWAEGLPESHIVLTSAIDGVDEWDLVRWVMTVQLYSVVSVAFLLFVSKTNIVILLA
jgi:peroxin-1